MSGKAAKVVITERQQVVLRRMSVSTVIAVRLRQRAQIILAAFAGLRNEEIAPQVGLIRKQIGTWRRRWARAWRRLIEIECAEGEAALRRAIEDVLSDKPRSGSPGTFTPEQITQILALACEPPELSGRPITHWTYAELAEEAKKRGIVSSISVSQVGHYLREAELQPHRSRYWLNTTEKDPARFQQQVEQVCDTYQQAPALYVQQGTHTVCVDEMTGIQALERASPTRPMIAGQIECREFEYVRHGTQTLIGNFHVVKGEMIQPTIGPTRTEEDFVAHIDQTVASDPAAAWVFVVDNLNTHCSESLVSWVANACNVDEELGKKRQTRRPAVASHAARVPGKSNPSHSVRVPAQAHIMAQPNRNRIRRHHAKSRSSRELLFGR
ncbi:MAG: IS630 family transposase [Chthoniobacterales bacterium]